MFRSLVPNLKFKASVKKLKAVFGAIASTIEKSIGMNSFGRSPGRLLLSVSIQPYKKL